MRRLLSGTAIVAAVVVFALVGLFVLGATALAIGPAGLLAVAVVAVLAVLAYWRARRGSPVQALGVAVLALVVGPAAVIVSGNVAESLVCEDGERRVLEALPHFRGAQPGVDGDLAAGGCIVRYTARAPHAEVVAHYEDRLREDRWRIVNLAGFDERGSSGELVAERDRYHLTFTWSREDDGTRVVIDAREEG